jgi:hypothetical protein
MIATLCPLCQSVPFHDLPPFPDGSYNRTLSGYEDFHVFLHNDTKDEIPNPFGFQHHTNLESLRSASASGCELCRQIEMQADGVLADIAAKYARYAQFPEVNLGVNDPSFHLWITKRADGGDGFWVSTKSASAPDRMLFPIATFGFCSEDGDFIIPRSPHCFVWLIICLYTTRRPLKLGFSWPSSERTARRQSPGSRCQMGGNV